jgi:glutamyl-tRNA reductase
MLMWRASIRSSRKLQTQFLKSTFSIMSTSSSSSSTSTTATNNRVVLIGYGGVGAMTAAGLKKKKNLNVTIINPSESAIGSAGADINTIGVCFCK